MQATSRTGGTIEVALDNAEYRVLDSSLIEVLFGLPREVLHALPVAADRLERCHDQVADRVPLVVDVELSRGLAELVRVVVVELDYDYLTMVADDPQVARRLADAFDATANDLAGEMLLPEPDTLIVSEMPGGAVRLTVTGRPRAALISALVETTANETNESDAAGLAVHDGGQVLLALFRRQEVEVPVATAAAVARAVRVVAERLGDDCEVRLDVPSAVLVATAGQLAAGVARPATAQ